MSTWRLNAFRVARVELVNVLILAVPDACEVAFDVGADFLQQGRDYALCDLELLVDAHAVLLGNDYVGECLGAVVQVVGVREVENVAVVHEIVLDRVVNVRNLAYFELLFLS